MVDSEPSPSVAEDVNHAADLIRKKLIRENDRPEKASKFSNLYSRLLSQPVLGQKWAILYFLYQLADTSHADIQRQLENLTAGQNAENLLEGDRETRAGASAGQRQGQGQERGTPSRTSDRLSALNSPTFNEAFARNGLPRLPRTETPDSQKPPPHRDREKHPPRPRTAATPPTQQEPDIQQNEMPQAPSETGLLRDLPFTLQGLSSTNLSFIETRSLKLPPGLPVPIISLLHTLAEPSLLYKSLAEFVDSSDGGLVSQSLRSAIGLELRSYLGLVATLEGQIRRALAQLDESLPHHGLGKAGVTLKRCVVWTREATMGLRLMSKIVEESRGNVSPATQLNNTKSLQAKRVVSSYRSSTHSLRLTVILSFIHLRNACSCTSRSHSTTCYDTGSTTENSKTRSSNSSLTRTLTLAKMTLI